MFHFPTFPPRTLCVQMRVTGLASSRVSPFGNPRITVWLSTPRGLSQIPTSFFGSWCQGIHRVPLKTWPQRCSRPLCSSQHTGGTPPDHPPTRAPALAVRDAVRPRTRPHPGQRPSQGPIREEQAHARPLRTQQRARRHPDREALSTPHPPKGKLRLYSCGHDRPAPTNRCSTLEQPHDTLGRAGPPGHHIHPPPTGAGRGASAP